MKPVITQLEFGLINLSHGPFPDPYHKLFLLLLAAKLVCLLPLGGYVPRNMCLEPASEPAELVPHLFIYFGLQQMPWIHWSIFADRRISTCGAELTSSYHYRPECLLKCCSWGFPVSASFMSLVQFPGASVSREKASVVVDPRFSWGCQGSVAEQQRLPL